MCFVPRAALRLLLTIVEEREGLQKICFSLSYETIAVLPHLARLPVLSCIFRDAECNRSRNFELALFSI